VDRVQNRAGAQDTALGRIPYLKDLSLEGTQVPGEKLEKLFTIDPAEWKTELSDIHTFFEQFGSRMPEEIRGHYKKLEEALR
jgi:phosphoenolpyruvate carboxykinase (GTP)